MEACGLFRNGDVAITTNGVTELRPRELPFPRDGYGQDDEWVTANFTNATEILAAGYPQCLVRKRRTLMGAEGC